MFGASESREERKREISFPLLSLSSFLYRLPPLLSFSTTSSHHHASLSSAPTTPAATPQGPWRSPMPFFVFKSPPSPSIVFFPFKSSSPANFPALGQLRPTKKKQKKTKKKTSR